MKILFVAPYLPSLIRVRPYNFIRGLAPGHEITLLATEASPDRSSVEDLKRYCRNISVVPIRRSRALRSCALAALRGKPLQAAYCSSPELEGELQRILSRGDFDVVHLEHLRAAHLGSLIPTGLPSLFDSVDCISLLLERTRASSHSRGQRLLALLEQGRCRSYERWALARFHRIAVTSGEDRSALLSLAPDADVAVVPNGVDLDYFHPMAGPRGPATLVFSGKMSYHANVTALLHFVNHILPLLRMEWPQVRLRVVGADPPAAVRALAQDPSISITGYLPDLRAALGGATVAICPVTVKVGIQNKLLEAMAMGLPVVSTIEGVRGLAVTPGQDLLVAETATEFAGQVGRLLADRGLRDRIGAAAREHVETHHRWEVAVRELERLYGEATERGGEGHPR